MKLCTGFHRCWSGMQKLFMTTNCQNQYSFLPVDKLIFEIFCRKTFWNDIWTKYQVQNKQYILCRCILMSSRCCGITALLQYWPRGRRASITLGPHYSSQRRSLGRSPFVLHPRLTRRSGTPPAGRLPGSVTRVIRAGHFLIYLKLINISLGKDKILRSEHLWRTVAADREGPNQGAALASDWHSGRADFCHLISLSLQFRTLQSDSSAPAGLNIVQKKAER